MAQRRHLRRGPASVGAGLASRLATTRPASRIVRGERMPLERAGAASGAYPRQLRSRAQLRRRETLERRPHAGTIVALPPENATATNSGHDRHACWLWVYRGRGLSRRSRARRSSGGSRPRCALCVVVERVRWVVELACLVVGEPGDASGGRVWEDRHAVVGLVDGERGGSAGGAFVLALALAAEGGSTFPVAKRAGRDAQLGGDGLLGHPLGEQLRGLPLLARSLLSAAALVGELLLRPRPRPPGRPPNGELPNQRRRFQPLTRD